jgi:hypothetical protein
LTLWIACTLKPSMIRREWTLERLLCGLSTTTKMQNVLSHFSCLILTLCRVYTLLHASPNKTASARQHGSTMFVGRCAIFTLRVKRPAYTSYSCSCLLDSILGLSVIWYAILTLALVVEGGSALKSCSNRSFCEGLNPPRI